MTGSAVGTPFGGKSADQTQLFSVQQNIVLAINTLQQTSIKSTASIVAAIEGLTPVVPLTSSVTYDPPSIASGAQTTTTVTVAGAALGSYAKASFSLDLAGLILTSYVSSANTVTVIFANLTVAPVDLASGILKVSVSLT